MCRESEDRDGERLLAGSAIFVEQRHSHLIDTWTGIEISGFEGQFAGGQVERLGVVRRPADQNPVCIQAAWIAELAGYNHLGSGGRADVSL